MNLIILNQVKIGASLISRYVVIIALASVALIIIGIFLIFKGISPQTLAPIHEEVKGCKFLIVFSQELNKTSKDILVSIASVISRYLSRSGVKCQGYEFLSKNKISNYTIPVYPALIIESSTLPSDLRDAFLKLSDRHWLLKPPYLYYLIQSGGGKVGMEYIYNSKAYIVEGLIDIPNLKTSLENTEELKNVLTWTSSTKVISIEKVSYERYPNLSYYPAIVIVPMKNINISAYSPIIISLEDNVFTYEPLWYNTNILPYILNVSVGNIMLEVHSRPIFKGPHLGNTTAPVKAIIFEDLNCPYCARLFNNTLPIMNVKYVSEGYLMVTFNILTVHEESKELHEALTCYYLTGMSDGNYYELLLKLYRLVIKGKHISIDDFRMLTNVDTVKLFGKCNATSLLNEFSKQARRYGVAGTPAILLWSDSKNVGVLIIGYVDIHVIDEIMNTLLNLG